MEIPRFSVEYSLVPHKRTKMSFSTLFWSAQSSHLHMKWGFTFSYLTGSRFCTSRVNGNKDVTHPKKDEHLVLGWASPTAVCVRSPDWLTPLGWDKPRLQAPTSKHNPEDFPALNGCRFYLPGAKWIVSCLFLWLGIHLHHYWHSQSDAKTSKHTEVWRFICLYTEFDSNKLRFDSQWRQAVMDYAKFTCPPTFSSILPCCIWAGWSWRAEVAF